jgi:hypothetical protein
VAVLAILPNRLGLAVAAALAMLLVLNWGRRMKYLPAEHERRTTAPRKFR